MNIIKEYPVTLFIESKTDLIEKYEFVPESPKICRACFEPIIDKRKTKLNIPILILGAREDKIINKKTILKIARFYEAKYKIYDDRF